MAERHLSGIAPRHVSVALAGLFILVVLVLAALNASLARQEESALQHRIEGLAATHSVLLADPIWNVDDDRVKKILLALALDSNVRGATVRDFASNTEIASVGQGVTTEGATAVRPIVFRSDVQTATLAQLAIQADDSTLAANRKRRFIWSGALLLTLLALSVAATLALRRVRQSDLKFEAIAQAAPDAIIVCDEDGFIVQCNPSTREIFGYDEAHYPRHAGTLLTARDRDAFQHILASAQRTPPSREMHELTGLREDGDEIPIELTVRKWLFGRHSFFITVIRDISQRTRQALEARALQERLNQGQKMEAVGTLAGGIAHDFNNILGAILGYTELGLLKTDDPELKKYLEESLASCKRARDLVAQLLTFSRQQVEQKEPILITPVVKGVLSMLRATIPTSIELQLKFHADQAMLLADPTQINQILLNLCTNAMQAIGEAQPGRITVELHADAPRPAAADLLGDPPPDTLLLCLVVRDTGAGIQPEDRDRIYEPFFTTKDVGQGTGLGLSVVHNIVSELNGAIALKTEPGHGAEFRLYLPQLPDTASAREAEAEPESLPTGHGHVLLVDDETKLLDVLREMLTFLGYTVSSHSDPEDAWDLLQADPTRFNAVITDLAMPKMNGWELAGRIRDFAPDLPIVICTGYSERVPPESAAEIGAREILLKPVAIRDVATALHRVLGGDGA
jgi:PAS domain S-box-containing protein